MSATAQGRIGFGGKRGLVWVLLASWLIPLLMTGAYIVLILTSEVDATGAAWEAIALGFVLVLWFLFRVLTEHAAMARAVGVGDADRVLELADFQLGRWRSARGKAPFHVYRALALELRGDWQAALAELDCAQPRGSWQKLAATVRVAALAETGRAADARAAFDAALRPPVTRDLQIDIYARLAEARLLAAEGDRAGADQLLARLADDVRAGSGTRDRAKALRAKTGR
jgi:hypothetical protein